VSSRPDHFSGRRIQAFVAFALFSALLYFFVQSRDTGRLDYLTQMARIDETENHWMRMSGSMYPLMFDLQTDFDTLAAAQQDVRLHIADLKASPVSPESLDLAESLHKAVTLTEDFKSEQAIFRNSRLIIDQTIASLKGLSVASPPALQLLSEVESAFLDYIGRRDPLSAEALTATADLADASGLEFTTLTEWATLRSHIFKLIGTTERLTRVFIEQATLPIPQSLDRQRESIRAQFLNASDTAAGYQVGLLFIAVLLLSFGAIKAAQVSRYVRVLNRANDELDARVRERTEELIETNNALLVEIDERRRAEEEADHSHGLLKEARRIGRIGNWAWDLDTDEHHWSEELFSMLEMDPDAPGNPFAQLMERLHADDREAFLDAANRCRETHTRISLDFRVRMPDGSEAIFHGAGITKLDQSGRPIRVLGTLQDVTRRRQTEAALKESEERYSSTVKLAAVGICQVSLDERFTHVNPQLCEILGYSAEELLSLRPRDITHPEDIDATKQGLAQLRNGEIDAFEVEKRYLAKSGLTVWAKLRISVKRHPDGSPIHFVSIVDDISSRKLAESRIQYLATHDDMTGLANRARFTELVKQATAEAKRHRRRCAVFFLDLDRFKDINDSLGHPAGDQLLRVVSNRLRSVLRTTDAAARLGGDEFCLLLNDIPDSLSAAVVAEKCLHVIEQPILIAGRELQPRVSIGISLYPEHASDHDALMKNADSAMYAAKQSGSHRYAFYTAELTAAAERRMTLEHDLRRSVEQGEFELHYQPQISLDTGQLESAEALVRWQHPQQGLVGPHEFIGVAEKIGLIRELGSWVLRAACAEAARWNASAEAPIGVAVNISSRQIQEGGLVEAVESTLADTGLDPRLLTIEITEGAIQTGDDIVETFNRIHELGVRIAIDDFGTGYSWLDSIRMLPIDTLKIDKRFVDELTYNREVAAIVATIFSMGRVMNMTVVAEGVETLAQVKHLRALGCKMAQGYYFSEPVPGDKLIELAPAGGAPLAREASHSS